MYGDDHKDLFSIELHFAFASREMWVGLRRISTPNEIKQEWKNRIGSEQMYQLNLIPCIGVWFKRTTWKKIKEDKKKK